LNWPELKDQTRLRSQILSPVRRINNGRGQAVLRCLAGRFSNALIYLREFVMFRRQVNHRVYISLPARRTR